MNQHSGEIFWFHKEACVYETGNISFKHQEDLSVDRTISSVFLAVGVLLILLGITEAESIASDISKFINGDSMAETVWLLVTGSAVSLIGIIGLMHNRQRKFG